MKGTGPTAQDVASWIPRSDSGMLAPSSVIEGARSDINAHACGHVVSETRDLP